MKFLKACFILLIFTVNCQVKAQYDSLFRKKSYLNVGGIGNLNGTGLSKRVFVSFERGREGAQGWRNGINFSYGTTRSYWEIFHSYHGTPERNFTSSAIFSYIFNAASNHYEMGLNMSVGLSYNKDSYWGDYFFPAMGCSFHVGSGPKFDHFQFRFHTGIFVFSQSLIGSEIGISLGGGW